MTFFLHYTNCLHVFLYHAHVFPQPGQRHPLCLPPLLPLDGSLLSLLVPIPPRHCKAQTGAISLFLSRPSRAVPLVYSLNPASLCPSRRAPQPLQLRGLRLLSSPRQGRRLRAMCHTWTKYLPGNFPFHYCRHLLSLPPLFSVYSTLPTLSSSPLCHRPLF